MKLLVVSESPLEKIGSTYYAVDTWIRFICNLSDHFDQVTLFAPVKVLEMAEGIGPPKDAWPIVLGNLQIYHHDYYNSYLTYYKCWPKHVFKWRRTLSTLINSHDVVLLRLPSPMVSMIARIANKKTRPLAVLVAGDLRGASDRIRYAKGLKRWLYIALANLLVKQEEWGVRRASLVCAYSEELAHRHRSTAGKIIKFRTPHLTERDFIHRDDTCQTKTIKLLSVCWLNPNKGLEFLLDAVALLFKKGYDIQLEIVGKERIPGYQAQLESKAQAMGISDCVTFRGWVIFDQMSEVYFRNDIQVISSLSEGTPRCIVEGAARGVPLVCTKAGGSADILTHEQNALLVPPGDAQAISDAIERLIVDGDLRRKVIHEGYESAREVTFERLGLQAVKEIHSLLQNIK